MNRRTFRIALHQPHGGDKVWVAVEGCIGAGKTTTVGLIGAQEGWVPAYGWRLSRFALDTFYRDPTSAAFETELGFLLLHCLQSRTLTHHQKVITDFALGRDLVFARLNLQGADLKSFERVYYRLSSQLDTPDLVVFLDVPIETLELRIAQRSRPYERRLTSDYLRRLHSAYLEHVTTLGTCVSIVQVNPFWTREYVADQVSSIIQQFRSRCIVDEVSPG